MNTNELNVHGINTNNDSKLREIIEHLYENNSTSKADLVLLINELAFTENSTNKDYLFLMANKARVNSFGSSVYIRGLIEFSNICNKHCAYCGLRSENTNVSRYRISTEDILEQCKLGYELGYRTFVLQSGEDPYYSIEILSKLIQNIKSDCKDAAVTLSIGERSLDEYSTLKKNGVDRFLLRHEAYNPELYKALHPNMSYTNRIDCLKHLKALGFQTGSGFMVGLKGQTISDLADDLLFLKEMQVEMVGIGPFMPHTDTPLGKQPSGDGELTLILIAIARLLLPRALMPMTTAFISLNQNYLQQGLYVGANVLMPNITPVIHKGKYNLYDNKHATEGLSSVKIEELRNTLSKYGYSMDMSKGDFR